jgi:hypothetical protein
MTLREWWKAWPWDVRLGYAAVGCFALWATLLVATGPDLFVMLSVFLVVPLMAIVALVVTAHLIIGPRRRTRVLPLVLSSGCVAAVLTAFPGALVDLHLIACVYLAGGPGAVNDWGQGLIREQQSGSDSRTVERDQLPAGVRNFLPGFVSVDGTIWSDLSRVRIEMGGGFYHYGVVVYPTGSGPPAGWWQGAVGWPPEVVFYHEE